MFRTLLTLLLLLLVAIPARAAGDQRKTEAQLKAVQAEIERVRKQVNRDQIESNRLSRELRDAEMSAGDLRTSLAELKRKRAAHAQRRRELAEEKAERQIALEGERSTLAGQLRTAHQIGNEEPLKLLLNQKDPARAGRMFVYYSYFGRARAEQIGRITEHVQRLETLEGELEAQDRELAAIEEQRRSELARLEAAREKRGAVLASLKSESRDRVKSLERLKQQKSGLEKLMRELRRAIERHPDVGISSNDAFARLRGKLGWPIKGRITGRFGESRAGTIRWDGMMFAAERGAEVRAISVGRVIYADWLPGLGLLAIIDHGEGYISLYGHNDRLYKAVGERVQAGEALAAAGDSGGRSRPELYFEIRKGGKPVDPRPWFRSASP